MRIREWIMAHRDDWIWFGPVLAVTVVVLVGLFDFYVLPHNDFIQFAKPAHKILNLQPFENYKILPLFPLAIALVSCFIPGDPTLLHAAQAVNLLSSLVFLVFFWRLGRLLLPRVWPLVVIWLIINPYFLEFTLQPLMNIFLLAMVTPALLAMAQRQDRAFPWGGLAALGRYDCALLAPVMGLCRFLESGRRWRYLLYGVLPMVPLAAWLGLSALHSRLINPYIEQLVELDQPMAFKPLLLMLLRMLYGRDAGGWDAVLWWELLIGLLLAAAVGLGFWKLWRRDRWLALSMGAFVVTYFGMHAVFVAANYRYNYPILPFLLLLIFLPAEGACARAAEDKSTPAKVPLFLAPAAGIAALGLWRFWGGHAWWLWLFACVYLACFFLFRPPVPGRQPPFRRNMILNLLLALGITVSLFLQLGVWVQIYQATKWRLSEFVAVKEWMDQHARPGDKILMPEAWYLEARFDPALTKAYVLPKQLRSEDIFGLVDECKSRRIRYVAWVSSMRDFGRVHWYHQETKAYLVNELGLERARSMPGFRLVATLEPSPGHRALVYEFRPNESDRLPRVAIRPNDMDESGNFLSHLLRSGWNEAVEGPPGRRYIWALGERSTFRLFLDKVAFGGQLRITAYPLHGPELPSQRIDLKVNGQAVLRLSLEPRERRYAGYLPPSLLRPGENRFEMEYAFAKSPAELGRGSDRRKLAVLFKEIAFEPLKVPDGTPIPDFFDGSVMDPNRGWPDACLLLAGWNPVFEGPPESRYVWATDRRATLQLYVKDPRPGGQLEFTAYPFKAPARPLQSLQLHVNGQPAGQVRMVGQEHFYALTLPGVLLRPGRNLFELEFDYVLSPKEIGAGKDARRLAALFKRIRFRSGSADADPPPPNLDLDRIDPDRAWAPQARFLLLEGWNGQPEGAAGRKYIRSREEAFALRLHVAAPAGGARLDFTAAPVTGATPLARELELSVNGRYMETVRLADQEQAYLVEIPPFLLQPGENRFSFRASGAVASSGRDRGKTSPAPSVLFREFRLTSISSETGPLPPELDGSAVDPNLPWPVQARYQLVDGWSTRVEGEPGQRYVWALGQRSLAHLFLRDVGEGGRLQCRAYPVLGPGLPRQQVTVSWNGKRLGRLDLKPEEFVYSLEIPAAHLVEGKNRIELRYAVQASPKDLGSGDDVRPLAVLFKRIEFVPSAAPVTRMPSDLDTTRIDPNQEWAVQKRFLLGSGWSQDPEGMPGKRYIWANGPSSVVRFYLAGPPGAARLEFRAAPARDPKGRSQRVAVALNGREAGQVLLANEERDYSLHLPREALAAGKNQLTLKYAYTIVPANAGLGADTRQLPARFRWIRLVEEPNPDR